MQDLNKALVAWIIFPFLVMLIGFTLFVLLDSIGLLLPVLFTLLAALSVLTGMGIYSKAKALRQDLRVHRSEGALSPDAKRLTVQLFGSYLPYVVEAADQLGDLHEPSTVPALLSVLERSVGSQNPGWCEVSEAIVIALGKIGDGRALPLLYKLETVRGIGIVATVREAIDAIEPHSSLLRASSAEMGQETQLLRPTQGQEQGQENLLRPM